MSCAGSEMGEHGERMNDVGLCQSCSESSRVEKENELREEKRLARGF